LCRILALPSKGMEANGDIPPLKGEAVEAASYRGGYHIIAPAGAGKTEVMSQRVRNLFTAEESPASVVAFPFTERAAASLTDRWGPSGRAESEGGRDKAGRGVRGARFATRRERERRMVPSEANHRASGWDPTGGCISTEARRIFRGLGIEG
jgi:hypothetical protein